MNLAEYKRRVCAIEGERGIELSELAMEYAASSTSLKKGDFFTDHIGTIKVEEIYLFCQNPPSCVYRGPRFTRSGKPFKSGEVRDAYQINEIKQD